MSRRNQSRRRRDYGRRQHELRERRGGVPDETDPWPRADDWAVPDPRDEQRRSDDGGYGSFAR